MPGSFKRISEISGQTLQTRFIYLGYLFNYTKSTTFHWTYRESQKFQIYCSSRLYNRVGSAIFVLNTSYFILNRWFCPGISNSCRDLLEHAPEPKKSDVDRAFLKDRKIEWEVQFAYFCKREGTKVRNADTYVKPDLKSFSTQRVLRPYLHYIDFN